ncbi:protein CNGC15b-like isoform X1 [Quercus lobata]|uniref:Cyclic nucleotide-binding domain-containing protein n=1 Tax=Quercus lobata TaxID=97700 RepID=A0A7N2M6L0_QUELO|nr:protein CNGC15b-like isoform X1 [Quercus lobata]XP_030927814.1 protein CNGC15b-like isoform X1 [Quercus lobata]
MATGRSRYVRFRDDLETANCTPPNDSHLLMPTHNINDKQAPDLCLRSTEKDAIGKYSLGRELSKVFSEDYDVVEKIILDPQGPVSNRWNKIFLLACLLSLFVDPLFFYLPVAKEEACIEVMESLEVALTIIRSMIDAFYVVQIFVRFRTAYVGPSSRVFGRGELVIDPSKIASRYLRKGFWLDLVTALPLPQILIWAAIPNLRGSEITPTSIVVRFLIIFQYLLRLYHIYPLTSEIVKANGVMMETAWAGAVYNLMLCMLASHVLGSCWYLLSILRQEECWMKVCSLEQHDCKYWFLYCSNVDNPIRAAWFKSSNISSLCAGTSDFFQFGIYGEAVTSGTTSSRFFNKYYFCLWWGLRNLSSLGQNLFTSAYIGEISFAFVIVILGLVLFALLIGNMQMYLQSTTIRLEEWRARRTDTEQWMHHRQLPRDLKQSVRRYDQYRWVATRGVDEEAILKDLPMDLRREIKRHLCLDLVRKVPLFDQMDDRMLDAICERLKPCLCTPGTCLVREGDPVNEMLFIVRGHLDSCTTNGGRSGFFNSCSIGAGDFCGEELLTWALDPRPNVALPSSTRTVKAITEVEAFALIAEDLQFVAAQFRTLHSKKVRQTFRFHSHQWRTWAACFIQAAWFRYKRLKEAAELKKRESLVASVPKSAPEESSSFPPYGSSFTTYAAKLAASTRRGGSKRCGTQFDILNSLQKPVEPDFTVEDR